MSEKQSSPGREHLGKTDDREVVIFLPGERNNWETANLPPDFYDNIKTDYDLATWHKAWRMEQAGRIAGRAIRYLVDDPEPDAKAV